MSEQDLTPEQLEQLREQLASVSAGDVVAEAAMSLIALAYVRLGIPPEQHARFRDLDAARLLIDALGGAPAGRGGHPPARAPRTRTGARGPGDPAAAQRAVGAGAGLRIGNSEGPALRAGPSNLAGCRAA